MFRVTVFHIFLFSLPFLLYGAWLFVTYKEEWLREVRWPAVIWLSVCGVSLVGLSLILLAHFGGYRRDSVYVPPSYKGEQFDPGGYRPLLPKQK